MKNVRQLHVCLITLLSQILLFANLQPAGAQFSRAGMRQKHGKPFVDFHAPMPKEVTRRAVKTTRAAANPQTVDITPNTPSTADANPFWSKDEQTIFFQSNRTKTLAAGTLYHIYTMKTDGSNVIALTGPDSNPVVGALFRQTEPASNPGTSTVAYIETDDSGNVDLVEMNLSNRAVRSLLKGNRNFSFTGLNHPEYGFAVGGNIGVVFAGQTQPSQPFHLYSVDTQSGIITQLTTGIADDRNPTLSPDPNRPVIAFDSNRADPTGSSVKGNRDVWAIGINPSVQNAVQVSNFAVGGQPSANIQPAWSTDKVDQPTGSQHFVNGTQLIAFASTRYDTANDGNANGINPNGTHDIYWLKVVIGPDPNNGSVFTVTTPESASNPGLKLVSSDPQHKYDDLRPSWPQFISTYRVAYQSDRSFYNPGTNDSGPNGQPTDIFASTLLDLDAPTLIRFNDISGDVISVAPRLSAPGSTVKISVKMADFETGISAVYAQIKNPNSKYQSSDGKEHKVFVTSFQSPDGANGVFTPMEYDSERIFIGSNPNDSRRNSYAVSTVVASIDDFFAFSGGTVTPDPGWLPLTLESRDPVTGISTYSANWKTDNFPTDYFVDIIAFDNAVNPFSANPSAPDTMNWKIYDNVWGFSTKVFTPSHNLLFVSDYAAGQKFFSSRFGAFTLSNVFNTFWGTESWVSEYDVTKHPTAYAPLTGGTGGTVGGFMNALGAKSYGARYFGDFDTFLYGDSIALDGTKVEGGTCDVPATQQYDLWRTLCRGSVPDSVLSQYLPHAEIQPADTFNGETTDRTVTVANRAVFWHAPYSGDLFTGSGTITDLNVQTQLHNFLQAGGRLFINGQDIGWALTLDGSSPNSFFSGDLRVSYANDQIPGPGLSIKTAGFFPFVEIISAVNGLVPATGNIDNPIVNDPWRGPKVAAGPGAGTAFQIIPTHHNPGPGNPPVLDHFMSVENPSYLIAGTNPPNPHDLACPGVIFADELIPVTTVRPGASGTPVFDFNFGNANTGLIHYSDNALHSRLVYCSFGLEGLSDHAFGNGTNHLTIEARRSELMHNALCWLRSGTVFGRILDTQGQPIPGVLVRLSNKVTISGNQALPVTAYTGKTDSNGNYVINGVDPEQYVVVGLKSGFAQHRETLAGVHGGFRVELSFRLTVASSATIKGKVTQLDGTTPIQNAALSAKDNNDSTAPVLTTKSDIDGNYSFDRVPAGTDYTVTCVSPPDPNNPGKFLFGASVPANYRVPDTGEIAPAQTYTGIDFKMKPAPGSVTGKVVDKTTQVGIGGAVVTATGGNNTVGGTATTQADGTFTLLTLDPGPYGLVATAPGYAPNTPVSVTVLSNSTVALPANIELVKVAPGSISGLVTRTSDNGVLEGVTITLKDGAGNTIVTGTTGPVQTGANNYRFNYKLDNVPAGVTYTVTASKSGFTPIPVSQQAAVATGVETQNINFQMDPLHTFTGQLSLVSAPYDYPNSDVGDLLAIPLADRSNQTFLFATWDLGGYIFYPSQPANTFHLGRGYFLQYKNNLPLSIQGTSPDPNGFDIPLNPGWNLIGCPYTFDIDWTRLAIVYNGVSYPHDDATHATAQHPVLIGDALYTFISGGYSLDFKLATWKGYWVRAFTNCVIHINPATDKFGRSASVQGASRAVLGGGEGWSLNLRLSAGGMKDNDNYIGVSSRAVDTYDRYKAMKPPVFGSQYTYLSIVNSNWAQQSGAYGVDIRSNSPALKTWTIEAAATTPNATATLSWPNAATIGRNATLVLTDLATGQVRDMRNSSGYTWQTGDKPVTRQFKIEATRTDRAGTLYVSGIAAQQSPGRSTGLSVNYSLSVPADVEVRILGGNGQLVRRLGSRATRAAGVNEAVWDLKSDKGVSMPAGAYIVEIRAQNGKNTVRAAQPVLVVR